MFQKIIKKIKEFIKTLDDEELFMIGSAIGFLVLGFLIYAGWQARLTTPEDSPDEEVVAEDEDDDDENGQEVVIEEDQNYENEIHGYEIVEIGDQINEKDRAEIFGLREGSDFIIEYQGVTHAVFENYEGLSLDEWLEEKIEEKGPRGESFEDQKSFLNIVFNREVNTPLGQGREIVRMNGFQSGELFIPYGNYILSFYYNADSGRQVPSLESSRNELMENIK